jgi:hypothetical protein
MASLLNAQIHQYAVNYKRHMGNVEKKKKDGEADGGENNGG